MKKLMIAVAAAAMIGGVKAAEQLVAKYDFVANLQTTQGQSNDKDTLIPHHAVAGQDVRNYMWYEDDILTFKTNGVDAATGLTNMVNDVKENVGGIERVKSRAWKPEFASVFTNLVWVMAKGEINGTPYPTIILRYEEGTVLTKDESDLLETIEAHYRRQSFGMWCGSWAWYVAEPSRCFRVVGADAIETTLYMPVSSCCSGGGTRYLFYPTLVDLITKSFPAIQIGDPTTTTGGDGSVGFLNRFGGTGPEWADNLEIYAPVSVNTVVTGFAFNGWLAGQGYNGKCHADGVEYLAPHQFSGYIVGWTQAPVCPDCCVRPLPKAIAFDCLDNPEPFEDLPTAAFGSFYIQMTAFDVQSAF